MSRKKVLIAYATAGIGHKKAALSVYEALKSGRADLDVKLIDVLDYANPLFKKTYTTTYLLLIKQLIFLWGILYHITNCKIVYFLAAPIRKMYNVINCPVLVKFLLEYKPDVIISTHFLLPTVCDYIKKKYKIGMKVITVITDYRVHSFWISPGVDIYIAGHERVKEELINKWGIPADKIEVMGIPVEPKFSAPHDKAALRRKFNIPEGSFVILLLSGGYGVGPFIKTLDVLNKVDFPLSAITICGHNKNLREKVERARQGLKVNVMNLGYVDNVDELMAVSDIGVGKAGGISSTEALNLGLPFAFIRVIPGQEKANAALCVNTGACVKVRNVKGLLNFIKEIKLSPDKLQNMRKMISRIKKPNAASDIAEFIKNLTKE